MIKTPENPEATEVAASKKEETSYRGRRRLRKLITPEKSQSLSQRVVQAGFWAFALRIVNQLFGLARTIVLARVLSPHDFGLFGIALLALSALETFTQTGFQAALIQRKGDVRSYLDTAWTVQAIRGVALAIILFGIAPYVAIFFGEPNAAPLLRVLGLSVIFQGLINIGVVFFQKELEFHKQFIYMFSGTLADFGVAIPAALILHNAWALIFGLLAGNLVRMIASYFIHPYRPRFRLERAKARELYTFGKWILGSSLLFFLARQGDDIIVGKLLGAVSLGLYQLAYRLSELPITEFTSVVQQIMFPSYSKIQDDFLKLKNVLLESLGIIAVLIFPVSIGILVLSPDFVRIGLGNKWLGMISALQLLSIYGLLQSLTAIAGPMFWAIGKPRNGFIVNMVRVAAMGIAIYPLTIKFGILGTALSVVIGMVAKTPLVMYYCKITVGISISEVWSEVKYPFLIALVSALVTLCFRVVSGLPSIIIFAIQVLAFLGSYSGFSFLVWKRFEAGPIFNLRHIWRRIT